jgi:predicted lipoprotein
MGGKVMSEQNEYDLKTWIANWPKVRQEVEKRLAEHAQRDTSLHFELTLAQLELRDIDEAVQRLGALGKILYGDDLTSAELHGTGNY